MARIEEVLLAVLQAVLKDKLLPDITLASEEWDALFTLAEEHQVLPLILDTVWKSPSLSTMAAERKARWRDVALRESVRQIVQTNEFLNLILKLQKRGLNPAVMKGIVCRNLYPRPMLRPSVDEDLLVSTEKAEEYHRALLELGLTPDDPELDPAEADEISYHKKDSPTYIELHTSLFPTDSDAYGELNGLFDGALERTVTVEVEDVTLRTLGETDHLLYLICHAYKHFLHSGVGIRQICDMGMFSEAYGEKIDFGYIRFACESVHMENFAAALFRIAERHLGFPMPEAFAELEVDETALLEDILSGGLYGTADVNRVHSSNMTLGAVAAAKKGKKQGRGLARSLFPPRRELEGRYPYLRAHPGLLPLAWTQRAWSYAKTRQSGSTSAAESLRIGRDRVALLKQYGIIE